ncbi:MAG: hypothetical protein GY811_20955 [Myxococcales bacterium]|nr:hypothetical protein [Myxococcales bacterium]
MGRLTGERRAIAAALLAMYGFLFLVNSLLAPEGWGPVFGSLAGLYGTGFLALVAGYFWARWFVIGLGLSGFMTGAISLFQMGALEPILVFYTATHLSLTLVLWGNGMARGFDGRKEWRERFHLDESATNRLGKSVIRVGVSLPFVLLMALAPKEDAALALLGGGSIVAGVWALTKMRSWALPAMGAGALTLLASTVGAASLVPLSGNVALNLDQVAVGAIGFTLLALAPFVSPVLNFLKSDK